MGFLDYLQKEWAVISHAPITFVVGALIIAGATWGAATLFFQQELATARQQRDYWKDRADGAPLSSPPATPQTQPAVAVSIRGADIFVPTSEPTFTGIALVAQAWNQGAPIRIVNWSLFVICSGKIPIQAQYTKIPPLLAVSGKKNSAVIRATESLGDKTSTSPLGDTIVEGRLLFYVIMPKPEVMSPTTRLLLTATDANGNEAKTEHVMGAWIGR